LIALIARESELKLCEGEADQLADVVDVITREVDQLEGWPRLHVVQRVHRSDVVVGLTACGVVFGPLVLTCHLGRVVPFKSIAGHVDHDFIFPVNSNGMFSLQLLCSISAKDINVALLNNACARMVPALVQSNFEQGPAIISNVISLDCGLTLHEVEVTRRIHVASAPDDVCKAVLLETVGEVSPL